MPPIQTLGTLLQLCGTVFTVVGLLWVLHVAKGQLAKLGGDAIGRWTNLLTWIAEIPPPKAHVSGMLTSEAQLSAKRQGFPEGTTVADVYARVQNELIAPLADEIVSVRNHVDKLAERLQQEINAAVTAERHKDEALRKRDFAPTLVGLTLSTIGYLCQLSG